MNKGLYNFKEAAKKFPGVPVKAHNFYSSLYHLHMRLSIVSPGEVNLIEMRSNVSGRVVAVFGDVSDRPNACLLNEHFTNLSSPTTPELQMFALSQGLSEQEVGLILDIGGYLVNSYDEVFNGFDSSHSLGVISAELHEEP